MSEGVPILGDARPNLGKGVGIPPDHGAAGYLQFARLVIFGPAAEITQSDLGNGYVVQMTQVVLQLAQPVQIGLRPVIPVKGGEKFGGVAQLFQ